MKNKHKEFAQSLRNIMRNGEKRSGENAQKNCDEYFDENNRSLEEILEAKFDELFGSDDDDD